MRYLGFRELCFVFSDDNVSGMLRWKFDEMKIALSLVPSIVSTSGRTFEKIEFRFSSRLMTFCCFAPEVVSR